MKPRQRALLISSAFAATAASTTGGRHLAFIGGAHKSEPAVSSTSTRLHGGPSRTVQSSRWKGNYRSPVSRICDTPKSKRMTFDVTISGVVRSESVSTSATLFKDRWESLQHVLTKAVIWKLLLVDKYGLAEVSDREDGPEDVSSLFSRDRGVLTPPHGLTVSIEWDIGDPNYLPDVIVMSGDNDTPLVWAECGRVKVEKELALMQRYPDTHLIRAHWGKNVRDLSAPLRAALEERDDAIERTRPYTFACLKRPIWEFVSEQPVHRNGAYEIRISPNDLIWEDL